MSLTLSYYQFFCVTENQYVYTWSIDFPTACPNNNTHQIDTNTFGIVNQITNFYPFNYTAIDTIVFPNSIAPNSSEIQTFQCLTLYNIYQINLLTNDPNNGNNIQIGLNTSQMILPLAQNITANQTIIYINQWVFAFLPGQQIQLTDGVNTTSFLTILNIDKINYTITVSSPIPYNYSTTNTNINVRSLIANINTEANVLFSFRTRTDSGVQLLPGQTLTFTYQNNSNSTIPAPRFLFEYNY
jgi:hypothetical protein